MLVYVTLKPVNVVFGLDQDTLREDSVKLLKTISVAGSGPSKNKTRGFYSHFCSDILEYILYSFLPVLIVFLVVVEEL